MNNEKIEIEKALRHIPSEDRTLWIKIGAALKTALGEDGFELFNEWSKKSSNYNEIDAKHNWKSLKPGLINAGTLFFHAKQYGYQPTVKKTHFVKEPINPTPQNLQQEEDRQKAIEKSQRIWLSAQPVSHHRYLEKKHITHPVILAQLKQTKIGDSQLLLVPVKDINGNLHSLQYIHEDGTKRFTANGQIKGHGFLVGNKKQARDEIILAEGLATASSIHVATGKPVLVTFGAANMVALAQELSKKNFAKNYTFAIDNDSNLTGFTKAVEARKYLPKARIVSPPFTKAEVAEFQKQFGKAPSDFNDLHLFAGVERITREFVTPQKTKSLEHIM